MPNATEDLPGVGLLPPRLDTLLRQLHGATARPVVIRGWGSPCASNDHLLEEWITGGFRAPTRGAFLFGVQMRRLVLLVCTLCEMVAVRDRTRSSVALRSGGILRDAPDIHLGWYSGVRRNRRTYS